MDPVLEEFCRVSGTLQIHVFRRMQRYFASELGPKLERLETENEELRAQVEKLTPVTKRTRKEESIPV
jgi:hypothetical protein